MNQEPRVVLEFKKDRTEYRLVYDGAAYAIQARDTMHSPYVWQPTVLGFAAFCEYVETRLLHDSSLTNLVKDSYIDDLEEALTTAINIGSITVPQSVEPIMRSDPSGDDLHIVRVSDIEDSCFYDAPNLATFMWKRYNTGDFAYKDWSF